MTGFVDRIPANEIVDFQCTVIRYRVYQHNTDRRGDWSILAKGDTPKTTIKGGSREV